MAAIRRYKFIAASVCLHLALAIALFWVKQGPPSPQPPPLAINIIETTSNAYGTPESQETRGTQTKLKRYYGKSLVQKLLSGGSNGLDTPSGNGHLDGSYGILPFGFRSGDLRRLKDFSLTDLIYQKIERQLIYPGVLSQAGISGTVSAQLLVKRDGTVDWASFRLHGSNKYLQIYILRLLRSVFYYPLEASAMRDVQNKLPIDLSFEFEITDHDDRDIIDKKKFIMGQVLGFYRNSYHSSIQIDIGPLVILPFPIPYASLDVIGLFKLFSKNDPLATFLREGTL